MTDHFIHVTEEAWSEQRPRAAYIHLALTADKLFSGHAALEKAAELRRLLIALAEHDFPDTAVSLTGASLDVSTGIFTRSSSVTYRLRVHVADVERLPEALDAIAEAKQARVSHCNWDYAHAASDELLADCATRALAKATRIATTVGVTLAGVHNLYAEQIAEPSPYPQVADAYGGSMMAMRKRSIGEELVGLDLGPTKKIGVRVKVAYALTR